MAAKKKKPGKQPAKKARAKPGKKRILPNKIAKTKKGLVYRPWYRKVVEQSLQRGILAGAVNAGKDADRLAKVLKIDPDLAAGIVDADIRFYEARVKEKRPKWMKKKDLLKLITRVRWREKIMDEFALRDMMGNILLNFDVNLFIAHQTWRDLKTWKKLAARMKEVEPVIEAQQVSLGVAEKAFDRDIKYLLYQGRPMAEKELITFINQEKKRPKKETRIIRP